MAFQVAAAALAALLGACAPGPLAPEPAGPPDASAGAPDAGAAAGTIGDPILIEAGTLPAWFVDRRDTRDSASSALDHYPPVAQREAGPEFVYRFTLAQPAKISLTLKSAAGAHLDAALLTALAPPALWGASASSFSDSKIDNTIGRALVYHGAVLDPGSQLDPGTYYVVIDSLDDARAGPYELRLKLALMPNLCTAQTIPRPNGVPREVDQARGCPAGMVRVPANPDYCVDKYEAMLVGLDAQGAPFPWCPYLDPGAQRVRALSGGGVIPQAYLNKHQSAAACAESGKRLCTYREWLRACRGRDNFTYPYGNTRQQEVNPRAPGYVFNHLTHPCIDQVPQGLDSTGWRPGCASQDGALDLMGNVHEWIDERDVWEASGHTRSVPPGHGAFAGGYHLDTWLNGEGCAYLTTAHTPDQVDGSTGFRCCADAQ